MFRRSALPLAATLFGCATSPSLFQPIPASTSLVAGSESLAVEWHDDYAFLDVTIDGKAAGHFLLDTGASVALLAPATTDSLGLSRLAIDGGFVLPGASGTSATITHVAPIRELRCGPVIVRDFHAVELDVRQWQQALGRPIVGVLPVTAFRDALLTIDYPARRIEVGEPAPQLAAAAHVLPLAKGLLPYVLLRVGETDVRVLLDTGSDGRLELPEVVDLPRRGAPVQTAKARTIGGEVPVHEVRLDADVDWAGHTLANPVVEFVADSEGSVGTRLLRHFRVQIDQPNRRATFSRAASGAVLSPPVRSAGVGLLREAAHWSVAYLLDGTPAAKSGLRVGDQILAIDGVEVCELPYARYQQMLAERDVLCMVVRGEQGVSLVDVPVTVLVR